MKKIKNTIVIALATLGVLFIILMIMPDDEEDETEAVNTETVVETEDAQAEPEISGDSAEDNSPAEQSVTGAASEEVNSEEAAQNVDGNNTEDVNAQDQGTEAEDSASQAGAQVNIPESELSDNKVSFKTTTLDNEQATQDIFAGYDLTLVHVWGTYCQPCVAEMGEYAGLYKELPENVNLVGVICDVYDGIESNVSQAHSVLDDAGAEFTNLRISDDLYEVISGIQVVPSSFFVDGEGHIVGSMLEGAGFEATKSRLDSYIE